MPGECSPVVGDRAHVQVFLDCAAAQLSAGVGPDDKGVGLYLPLSVRVDVVLHKIGAVLLVLRVSEVQAAARLEAVDPGQAVRLDELATQAESLDFKALC